MRSIYFYIIWAKTVKINKCEVCGKRIEVSSNRQKYCNKCWKEKERELRKEINKKEGIS